MSGGIKEQDLPNLNPLIDAYGIGTSISNAPVIDFAMDIMEVEGKPLAKRGKWSGSKRVLRCQKCNTPLIVPQGSEKHKCRCGGGFSDILMPFTEYNKILQPLMPAKEIRAFVLEQVKDLELTTDN